MIDSILKLFPEVFKIIMESSILVWWFTVTTLLVAGYAYATNHLSYSRLAKYAILFLILWIGIEGPKINYIVVFLEQPITNPGMWMGAIFSFYFFTAVLIGLFAGFIVNKSLEFWLGDYWYNLSKKMRGVADKLEKRSATYRGDEITTFETIRAAFAAKQAEKLTAAGAQGDQG